MLVIRSSAVIYMTKLYGVICSATILFACDAESESEAEHFSRLMSHDIMTLLELTDLILYKSQNTDIIFYIYFGSIKFVQVFYHYEN